MNDFSQVKEGDKVIRYRRFEGKTIEIVTKVTKTQIQIRNNRYRRLNGNLIGKGKWDVDYISIYAKEDVE